MLDSWIQSTDSKELIASWSELIGLDLLRLGTTADSDEIKETANAQPLIVATSLLSAHALGVRDFELTSGHSVGEVTAAALSGAISMSDALLLVRVRGVAMAKAASSQPAGMSAVLGGDRIEVLQGIASLGLTAANDNGAGQIVAAGDLQALTSLAENPPTGARVRALAVAGAFHTSYMQSAVDPVRELTLHISTTPTAIKVVSNKDGAVISDPHEILSRIVDQIENPVRWDLCMNTLKSSGITGVIELAPAGTLVGLLKRATPDIECFALKSADNLPEAREFAERHL
jgi:[acyl-carrier-protein] S-malonyltransferase